MKEATAAHSSSQEIPRAALLREHPGVAELEQEKGLGMRGILLPAHPFCFPTFLSTTATSQFWRSDRQLTKLAHLAFINGHNQKPPRTWARWKEILSNIGKQKHLLKPPCFLVKFSVVYCQVSTKSSPLGIGVNTSLSTANCYSVFMSLTDTTTGKHSQ